MTEITNLVLFSATCEAVPLQDNIALGFLRSLEKPPRRERSSPEGGTIVAPRREPWVKSVKNPNPFRGGTTGACCWKNCAVPGGLASMRFANPGVTSWATIAPPFGLLHEVRLGFRSVPFQGVTCACDLCTCENHLGCGITEVRGGGCCVFVGCTQCAGLEKLFENQSSVAGRQLSDRFDMAGLER